MSESNHPERFFQYDGQGGMYLIDPISSEQLTTAAIPRVVQEDPISSAGLEYLELIKDNLHIDLIPSWHGGKRDFEPILGETTGYLLNRPYIAVEANWDTTQLASQSVPPITISPDQRGEFNQAEVDWAAENGKTLIPFDYGGPMDALRTNLLQLCEYDESIQFPELREAFSPEDYEKRRRTLCSAAYKMVRCATILPQAAYWLERLNIAEPGNLSWIMGLGNTRVFQGYLKTLGVAYSIYPARYENELEDFKKSVLYYKSLGEVISGGHITAEALNEVVDGRPS